jgi:Flp pilus assembly protein TadD
VQQNEPKPAVPLLEAVATSRPDLWGTHYYLGKAQMLLGNAKAALPLLDTAAQRAPGEAPVHYQRARALQSLGRAAEAKQAFARVAQLQRQANSESIVMK